MGFYLDVVSRISIMVKRPDLAKSLFEDGAFPENLYPNLYVTTSEAELLEKIYDLQDAAFLEQIRIHTNTPNTVIDITLQKCGEYDGAVYKLDYLLSQDKNFENSIKTIDPFQAKRLIDGIQSSSDKATDLLPIDDLIHYVVTILRTQSTDPTIQSLFVQTAYDCGMTTPSFDEFFRANLNTYVSNVQQSQTNPEQGG
jgi:hypothetical protein